MESNYFSRSREIAMAAPIPARTETYTPVSHSNLIEAMTNRLKVNKLEISTHNMYSNLTGTKLVGFIGVKGPETLDNPHNLEMMLAYRNSYDKSMSVGFAAGARVWICENGLIHGDILAFRRKHMGTVMDELNDNINAGVDRMRSDFGRINMEVDVLRGYSLTPKQKAEVLGVMYFEEDILTPQQLSIVKKELTDSKHFKEDNAWSLYNNVTESLKRSHPTNVIQDHIQVHDYFRGVVGLAPNKPEPSEPAEAPA